MRNEWRSGGRKIMKDIESFLEYLRKIDVRLWVDNDYLRYSAPKGAMTTILLTQLKQQKENIIEYLNKSSSNESYIVRKISPVCRGGDLCLSFSQQRLWLLDQLESQQCIYNIPVALQLSGLLLIEKLEKSLNEVIRRHEILRTTFTSVDGKPKQVIASSLTIPL